MVLDRPIEDAEEGKDYVRIWNAETMNTVQGKQFILAGWGASGVVKDDGDESHHVSEIFHRGFNVVNNIHDNMLVYTMDKPSQGGLPLEAMGHNGDSGSGALVDIEGELFIAGVKSNGETAMWGSANEYTRVGGLSQPWIEANLNSLEAEIPVESCLLYPNNNDYGEDAGYDEEGQSE